MKSFLVNITLILTISFTIVAILYVAVSLIWVPTFMDTTRHHRYYCPGPGGSAYEPCGMHHEPVRINA